MTGKSAKDLHTYVSYYLPQRGYPTTLMHGDWEMIARALDLLAAVEGSQDEIVRKLRGQHCRDFGSDPQCDADGLCICAMHERAAAALVAMEGSEDAIVRELREQADEERDFQYADRAKLLDKAAAALVATRAAKEKAEAEREADLNRAFRLGQTYWQQADSESYAQNRKAAETMQKFSDLRDRAAHKEKP